MAAGKSLERFLADKPAWVRLVVVVPFLTAFVVGMLALTFGFPSYMFYKAATAEPTTALVERCERQSRSGTACYGTWPMPDRTTGSGRIDGASRRDIGTEVGGWATPWSATTSRTSWWVVGSIITACVLAGLTLAVLILRKAAAAQQRRRST